MEIALIIISKKPMTRSNGMIIMITFNTPAKENKSIIAKIVKPNEYPLTIKYKKFTIEKNLLIFKKIINKQTTLIPIKYVKNTPKLPLSPCKNATRFESGTLSNSKPPAYLDAVKTPVTIPRRKHNERKSISILYFPIKI